MAGSMAAPGTVWQRRASRPGWLGPCSGSRGSRRRGGGGSATVMRRPQRPQMARPWSRAGPSRAGPAARSSAVGGGVGGERLLVGFELVPGDVAGVGVVDQRRPLVAGNLLGRCVLPSGVLRRGCGRRRRRRRSGGCAGCAAPASGAAACQASSPLWAPVRTRSGNNSPSCGKACTAARAEPVRAKVANRWRDGVLHAGVGVQHDLAGRVVDEPDGQRHVQLAAAGLGQLAAAQPGPDEVQLGLATSCPSTRAAAGR